MKKADAHKALEMIDQCIGPWREFVPDQEFDWFVDRIKTAIEVYCGLPDPAELSAELKKIERASRRPSREFVDLIKDASSTTRKVLEEHGGRLAIPSPDDDEAIADLAAEIRSRIIVGSYWRPEGKKRRWMARVTTALPFKRPRRRRLEVLVSLVCAAYSGATGKPTRRAWDLEERQGIEIIMDNIFRAIGIGDTHSSQEALRRQVQMRNSSNL